MQKKLVVLFIFVMLALSILIVRIIMLTFESGTLYQKQVLIQQQIVGKSDRCQLVVLQGMLQTPDDDGSVDDNLCLVEERE